MKNDVPVKAYIYDAAKRQRYQLTFMVGDGSRIAVTEFRYNSFGNRTWKIEYANSLTLTDKWDSDWFVTVPIQFLSQLGTVATSGTDDRVTYYQINLTGLPQAEYSGSYRFTFA